MSVTIGSANVTHRRSAAIAQSPLVRRSYKVWFFYDGPDTLVLWTEKPDYRMTEYCCDTYKCFEAPDSQVDGKACNKCEAYSFCHCQCKSWTVPGAKKDVTADDKQEFLEYTLMLLLCMVFTTLLLWNLIVPSDSS